MIDFNPVGAPHSVALPCWRPPFRLPPSPCLTRAPSRLRAGPGGGCDPAGRRHLCGGQLPDGETPLHTGAASSGVPRCPRPPCARAAHARSATRRRAPQSTTICAWWNAAWRRTCWRCCWGTARWGWRRWRCKHCQFWKPVVSLCPGSPAALAFVQEEARKVVTLKEVEQRLVDKHGSAGAGVAELLHEGGARRRPRTPASAECRAAGCALRGMPPRVPASLFSHRSVWHRRGGGAAGREADRAVCLQRLCAARAGRQRCARAVLQWAWSCRARGSARLASAPAASPSLPSSRCLPCTCRLV